MYSVLASLAFIAVHIHMGQGEESGTLALCTLNCFVLLWFFGAVFCLPLAQWWPWMGKKGPSVSTEMELGPLRQG